METNKMDTKMKVPRVFISYSHDSAEHKSWVLDFATTLRNRGVDAILDQWDLRPGDDLPLFMESNLESCDFVVMICSEKYVKKANAGEGGVGYEKMIMTSSMLKRIDSSKVIPIIRQVGTSQRPTFLNSKLYIDLSKDEDVEYSLDELLRTLLNSPLYEKPEIGKNPFVPMEHSKPDRISDGLKEVMKSFAKAFDKNTKNYVTISDLLPHTNIHRLTFDKYLNIAIKEKLIVKSQMYARFSVTENGSDYLIAHNIINE
jgi:predicted transcriptional regulator